MEWMNNTVICKALVARVTIRVLWSNTSETMMDKCKCSCSAGD